MHRRERLSNGARDSHHRVYALLGPEGGTYALGQEVTEGGFCAGLAVASSNPDNERVYLPQDSLRIRVETVLQRLLSRPEQLVRHDQERPWGLRHADSPKGEVGEVSLSAAAALRRQNNRPRCEKRKESERNQNVLARALRHVELKLAASARVFFGYAYYDREAEGC